MEQNEARYSFIDYAHEVIEYNKTLDLNDKIARLLAGSALACAAGTYVATTSEHIPGIPYTADASVLSTDTTTGLTTVEPLPPIEVTPLPGYIPVLRRKKEQ